MNVAELIEKLQSLPQDAEVITWDDPYVMRIYNPEVGHIDTLHGVSCHYVAMQADLNKEVKA